MLASSTRNSRLCLLVILQCLLVQQCLLQPNIGCEASATLEGSMSQTGPQTEAQTSVERTGVFNSTQPQADLAPGQTKTLASRLKEAANLAIAPARNYFQLIQRYKQWRDQYNRLQEEFGHDHVRDEPILRDAIDVLRIEYAKVDRQLHEEACQATHDSAESDDDAKRTDVENVDFILRVLRLLIDRLEERLEMLRRGGVKAALDEQLEKSDAEAEREAELLEAFVKGAAERAKRIAAKSAKGLLKNELLYMAQSLALNAVATYVVNSNQAAGSDATSMMSRIEPIVLLMGSANTGLLVSYMRDIKTRAGMKIFNYSLSMFTCKRKSHTSLQAASTPPPELSGQEISSVQDAKD